MPSQTADGNTNPSLIPFVIGVTCHRDLRNDDVPALEAAVCSVFDDPHQTELRRARQPLRFATAPPGSHVVCLSVYDIMFLRRQVVGKGSGHFECLRPCRRC